MNKIRGTIDRIEGDKAVIRYDGSEVIVPKDILKDLSEGDVVVITFSSEEEDTKSSREVAEALLTDVLKGE